MGEELDDGAGLYEVKEAEAPVRARAGPAGPTEAVLGYRGKAAERGVAGMGADEARWRDVVFPMWLLGGGVVVLVVAGLVRAGGDWAGALSGVGLGIGVGTGVMVPGVWVAARARGVDLGRFWTMVFKVAAISVAPEAVLVLAGPVLRMVPVIGGLAGLLAAFAFYFALIGLLFELDQSDTWYFVWVVFLVKVAVVVGAVVIGWG